LPHGYTNATCGHGGVVRKSYLGPDPQRRLQVELAALKGLHGRFPVPAIVPGPDGELRLEEVAGWHGQEALDSDHAAVVLRLCGQTHRRLREIDPTSVSGLPGSGGVIVHGDFGPQNILLNHDASEVLAVIDWELCHLGSAIEDLAWAEWIVRMHHPPALRHLDELFAGARWSPPWPERKAAMLAGCRRCREFGRRWGDADAVLMWDERIAITEAFQE
jgi:aminoglycoside phosphotransferase (APT) family kinase protein